jgi:hypothetical protein
MPKRTFTLTIPAAARTPALTLTGAGAAPATFCFDCSGRRAACKSTSRSRHGCLYSSGDLVTKLADQLRDKGEFCRGEPYLFFKDLAGYEVEIAFELPTSGYPKPSKITCLSHKALSYSRFSKIKFDNYFWTL